MIEYHLIHKFQNIIKIITEISKYNNIVVRLGNIFVHTPKSVTTQITTKINKCTYCTYQFNCTDAHSLTPPDPYKAF